jgi:hypothetical protein
VSNSGWSPPKCCMSSCAPGRNRLDLICREFVRIGDRWSLQIFIRYKSVK